MLDYKHKVERFISELFEPVQLTPSEIGEVEDCFKSGIPELTCAYKIIDNRIDDRR